MKTRAYQWEDQAPWEVEVEQRMWGEAPWAGDQVGLSKKHPYRVLVRS